MSSSSKVENVQATVEDLSREKLKLQAKLENVRERKRGLELTLEQTNYELDASKNRVMKLSEIFGIAKNKLEKSQKNFKGLEEICKKKKNKIGDCRNEIATKREEIIGKTMEYAKELEEMAAKFKCARDKYNVNNVIKESQDVAMRSKQLEIENMLLEKQHQDLLAEGERNKTGDNNDCAISLEEQADVENIFQQYKEQMEQHITEMKSTLVTTTEETSTLEKKNKEDQAIVTARTVKSKEFAQQKAQFIELKRSTQVKKDNVYELSDKERNMSVKELENLIEQMEQEICRAKSQEYGPREGATASQGEGNRHKESAGQIMTGHQGKSDSQKAGDGHSKSSSEGLGANQSKSDGVGLNRGYQDKDYCQSMGDCYGKGNDDVVGGDNDQGDGIGNSTSQ